MKHLITITFLGLFCFSFGQERITQSSEDDIFENNDRVLGSAFNHAVKMDPTEIVLGRVGVSYDVQLVEFFGVEAGLGAILPNSMGFSWFGLIGDNNIGEVSGGFTFSIMPKFYMFQSELGYGSSLGFGYINSNYSGERARVDKVEAYSLMWLTQLPMGDRLFFEYAAGFSFEKYTGIPEYQNSFDNTIRLRLGLALGYIF